MQLSDLLRLTLEHLGQQEVTLDAELDALSKYVAHRTDAVRRPAGGRASTSSPRRSTALVPSLLLQPLVENAIKYGVARQVRARTHRHLARGATATSCGSKSATTASGLTEDALTALQKGIGVSTTRARLQHLFGADYRFEFHRLAQGLAVVVAAAVAARRRRGAATPGWCRRFVGQPDRRAEWSEPGGRLAAASPTS